MSILIKNVQVVDGTGSEPYKADVFIDKNIISAIGDLKKKQADEVIEGAGNFLTPGFIDIDTSSDHYLSLLTNPLQDDFTKQGVTTIIGGHCGSSLAPLLYGTLESIRKWVDINQINVNWHTINEFLETLSNFPLGVNFGTLVGHSTIRRSITGEGYRDLTKDEMMVFKKILAKAMSEGAYGLSTGLGYAHGRLIKFEEVKSFLGVVKDFEGIYSTHLRDEREGLLPSIDETIKLAADSGVRTIISHLRPLIGFEEKYEEAYSRIAKSRSSAQIYSYVYPYDTSLEAIYKLLPLWAQEKNLETMLENIKNPEIVSKIEKDLNNTDLSRITISDAPKHDYLVGKTPMMLSEMFDLSPVKALIKAMEITKLRATVFNKNINYKSLLSLLADSNVFIASNGASRIGSYKFLKHERSMNTFTKYLEIVLGEKLMELPQAIKRITSFPANFLNIKDRGVVKEGLIADITLLDKNDYKVKEVVLGGRTAFGVPLKHNQI